MKYIEFLGLPGSGKTTLAEDTVTILRANRRSVFTKLEARNATVRAIIQNKSSFLGLVIKIFTYFPKHRLLNFLWRKAQYPIVINFIREHPHLVQHIIECAKHVEPPLEIAQEAMSDKKLIDWFFDLASTYQASHDFLGNDDVLLLEEGFCQQAYYLLIAFRKRNTNNKDLENYLQLIPKPHLVFSILTDPEKCEKRMNKRQKGVSSDILRFLTVSERILLLEQRLKIYKKIVNYLEKRNVAVIRLENNNYRATQQILEETLVHF